MAQINPFDQFDTAPQGVLTGPPPDPFKTAGDKRDETRTGIAVEGAARDARREVRDATKQTFEQESKLRDDFNQNLEVKAYKGSLPALSQALRAPKSGQGDLSVVYAYAKIMDPNSVVREGEMDMVVNSSPVAMSMVQNLRNQFDSSGRLPESTRRGLEQEMIRATQARRKSYETQYGSYTRNAESYGLDPLRVVGQREGEAYLEDMQTYDKVNNLGRFADQPTGGQDGGGTGEPFSIKPVPEGPQPVGDMSGAQQVATGATKNVGAPEIENRVNQMWLQGKSMSEINGYLAAQGYEQALVAPNEAESRYWRKHGGPFKVNREVPLSVLERTAASPVGSYAGGAADAMTLGLSDEIYGAANAMTGGDYEQARDEFQGKKVAQAELNPKSSLLGNVSGAILAGPVARMVGGAVAPAATARVSSALAANPVAASTGIGALYGAGSDNDNRLRGAVLGGTVGGVVGKGIQMGSPVISNALAARGANRGGVIPNASDVAAAGQAEGVTVNRAMIDPRLENRVSGVDASLAGGPAFRRGMSEIEGQIEGRVNALGRDGNVMDNATAGQAYQDAGTRYIKDSGKAAKVKYDRAERLAGDAKVTPTQSLKLADEMIGELGGSKPTGLLDASGKPINRIEEASGLRETPSTFSNEISFLQGIRNDLSKDLSVGALRRMRTSLRKKISNGDLVFGEDEARVLGIMDAAATDIRAGLEKQGLGKAARAFDVADKEYRGRMEFITGTLQKVIGKRNSNLSSEQVAKNLNGMLRGRDTEGARAFLSKLTPEEHADFAATIADSLGKNNRGEFSIAHFLTQTGEKKFPLASLKVAFGEDGARSIQNLRVISKELDRVNKMRNTSNTARAADYRSVLFNAALGLGSGVGAGVGTGSLAAGVATAATAGSIKAARDMLSARMLLNPNITKWIRTAPRTANPAAINAHLGKLESMTRAGTIGRMDAQAIQDYLRNVVGQSPMRAAASEEEGD